jgi:hypothetical protein
MTTITRTILAGAAIALAFASTPALAATGNTAGMNGVNLNGVMNGVNLNGSMNNGANLNGWTNGWQNGWANSWNNGWANGQSTQTNGQALRVIGIELPR